MYSCGDVLLGFTGKLLLIRIMPERLRVVRSLGGVI